MSILGVMVICILVGVLLYFANKITMQAEAKTVMNLVVILLLVLFILSRIGLFGFLSEPIVIPHR